MSEGGGGALRELLAHFQVEVDHRQLEVFEHGLGGVMEKLKGIAGAFAGILAAHEIKEFFLGTIEQTAHLADLSEKLGVSTEEIQKFQFAASLAGVSAESAAGALGKLNKAIGSALHDKEAEEKFKKLGIELKGTDGQLRETGDVVLDIADKMKGLKSAPERAALAMKFFGRSGMALVPMLQEGREEMEKLYKEFEGLGGVMSKDFVQQAKKADDEMTKMRVAFQGLRVRAINTFLPRVFALIKMFEHYAMVAQRVLDKTHAMQHAFDFVKILATIKAVMMLVNSMSMINPFTLMIVGAIALFLVFDDLMTMMEGGNSVIGNMLGPDKEAMVLALKSAFEEIKATWIEMLPNLKEIGVSLAGLAVEALPLIVKGISLALTMTLEWTRAIKAILEMFSSLAKGNFFDAATSGLSAAGHMLDSLTGGKLGIGEYLDQNSEKARQYRTGVGKNTGTQPGMEGGAQYALPGFTPAFIKNALLPFAPGGAMQQGPVHIQQTFHTNVDVTAKTDLKPDEVGEAIGQGVMDESQKQLIKTKNAVKKK